MKNLKKALVAVAGGVVAFASTSANAALTIDVTPVTDAGAAVAAVGAAVFLVIAGIAAYKWARRAL